MVIDFFIGLFSKVFYGHLMPQSTYPDLAVCLDVSNPERFYAADHCLDETVLKNKVGFDDTRHHPDFTLNVALNCLISVDNDVHQQLVAPAGACIATA